MGDLGRKRLSRRTAASWRGCERALPAICRRTRPAASGWAGDQGAILEWPAIEKILKQLGLHPQPPPKAAACEPGSQLAD
jgi:hypothetical protein